MAIIRRFQDLRCWQEARKLVNFIYKLTQHEAFSKEYELKGQLRKTVISIMNNIAEGFSRFNRNDFMRFLDYSQSSASELLSMTYVLEDLKMINGNDLIILQNLIESTKNQTLGLAKYIKSSKQKTNELQEPEINYLTNITEMDSKLKSPKP